MHLEGELRLLHPKRGDLLALYADPCAVEFPEALGGVLAELRRAGVLVLILPPRDAVLHLVGSRTVREVLDDWLAPHGFRAVPR